MHARARTHTHTHTHIRRHTHTHTHTHTGADTHTDNSTDNAVIQHIQQWTDLGVTAEECSQMDRHTQDVHTHTHMRTFTQITLQ